MSTLQRSSPLGAMTSILVVCVALVASPALSSVIINFNADTAGTTPSVANTTGVSSFADVTGTSVVAGTQTWDAGASSLAPDGANMLSLANGNASAFAVNFDHTLTGTNISYSLKYALAYDNGTASDSLYSSSSTASLRIMLGSSSIDPSGTSGKVGSIAQGIYGGAFRSDGVGGWTNSGFGFGQPKSWEAHWFEMSGTINTDTQAFTVTLHDLTNGRTDSTSWTYSSSVTGLTGMVIDGIGTGGWTTYIDSIQFSGEDLSLIAGDANGDGVVNLADLSSLINHYGMTSGATWANGDFNSDGKVDLADLSTIINHYGGTSGLDAQGQQALAAAGLGGVSPVPEPSSLVLLVVALLGLGGYCLRRR